MKKKKQATVRDRAPRSRVDAAVTKTGDDQKPVLQRSDDNDGERKGAQTSASHDLVDDEVLDEGCYYLSKLGLSSIEISRRFELQGGESEVEARKERFLGKLAGGTAAESPSDAGFWKSIREEAEGNVKVTFVTEKGFHHAWRSELELLDGPTLLSIFDSCKRFLNLDPNSRFLQYDAPKNYDPLAMQREITKAVNVISSILESK